MSSEAVRLRRGQAAPPPVAGLPAADWDAVTEDERVALGVELAERLGRDAPRPGRGRTRELWELLAGLGALDLTVARVVEPHLDALAILDEAGRAGGEVPGGLLGVYAAEGPGVRLHAEPDGEGRWRLTGTKPWCSLADRVGGFLVTAWVDDSRRGLFLVDARRWRAALTFVDSPWVARGLSAVTSPAVELAGVPAVAVGEPQWYLERPGFAWGGIGVAAIWWGGAVGVGRRVHAAAAQRPPDQVALMLLGAIDGALERARALLADAADRVDDGRPPAGGDAAILAARVRQVVSESAEEVLRLAGHALGPGPLTAEESHARRVHDLGLYLRQGHAERDQAALGALLLKSGRPPW